MPYLKSFSGHTPDGFVISRKSVYLPTTGYSRPGVPYKDDWDVERSIDDGLNKVTWVYKSCYAIASNAARLPIQLRKDNARSGEVIEGNKITDILNKNTNNSQDAFTFRFMLSEQILLSKKGAFVEVVRNKVDDIVALNLLPPSITYPVPDSKNFVSEYVMELGPGLQRKIPKESVIWIKIPHPTDPYKGQTPLEAAGLAIEYDYYSKVYNRNFVVNDARPGGILVISGELGDEEAEEVKRRFSGSTGSNIGGAGRLTVMGAEDAKYIDTTTSQRDSQYVEARQNNKDEILMAFGVPESILGNASGRTFANSDVEMDIFWRETMLPHLTLIERSFDQLDSDPTTFISHDLSSVAVLDRDARDRAGFHLEELKQGAISIDEYRILTGRNPVGINDLLVPTNLSPVMLPTNGQASGQPTSVSSPTERLNPEQRPGRPSNQTPGPNTGAEPVSDQVIARGEGDGPSPLPVFPAPMVSASDNSMDEVKIDNGLAERRYRHIQRLETSIALQVASLFKRQRRVILEKASSRKMKEKWESGSRFSAEDVFDIENWNSQIVEDAKTWISAIFLDGNIELTGNNVKEIDIDSSEVSEIISSRSAKMSDLNKTTLNSIQKTIEQSAELSHDDFVKKLDEMLSASSSSRVASIARTEVVGAFNSGMMWAAKKLGYTKKTWLSVQDSGSRHSHSSLSNETVGIDEYFAIDGKSVSYPGDHTANVDSVINCRCTLQFHN